MKTNVLHEMIRFQKERELDTKDFNIKIASMNILEELLEAHGVEDDCKESKKERKELLYNALLKLVDEVKLFTPEKYVEPTEHSIVDAFCDISEFAIGEPLKLGYDIEECLTEMCMEINSRTGSIINGKFEKFKTKEAMKKWYIADYSKAKIKTKTICSNHVMSYNNIIKRHMCLNCGEIIK